MSQPQDLLTTQAFAKKVNVSAATVSKWLRSGKLNGQKINGKWFVAEVELSKAPTSEKKRAQSTMPHKTKPAPKAAASQSDGSGFSVEAFSAMTYLTEYGVKLWLKTGRLMGVMDDKGQPGVAASNLDQPHIKRLLR